MADAALPSFRNPPVTEVVVGVVIKPIEELTVPRIGQLWSERFASVFPRAEEQAPYEPPVERFDESQPSISLGLQLGLSFPRPRVWFVNETGDELVQIQRNYFACNWRKVHPETEYGRWESRRSAFARWFQSLETFVAEHGLGGVSPTQCEVTYVNHIEPAGLWSAHPDAPAVFRMIAAPGAEENFPGSLEQVQMATQFRLLHDGEPFGRLHVTVQPAFKRSDNQPIYIMELTARGRPLGDDANGMHAFFEEGRRAIVTAFAACTTPEMHEVWGRYA